MDIKIAGTIKHSSVNGPGVRYVLFMQGCPHKCEGCQNPETHNLNGGTTTNTKQIIDDILKTNFIDGVTLSGGDPFMQPKATLEMVMNLKKKGLNIWIYTGYLFESIYAGELGDDAKKILNYCDVLVDGKFVKNFLSENTIYRGSSNQRLVDLKKSLNTGKAITFKP